MSALLVRIKTDNAAFDDPAELSRILRKIAREIDQHVVDARGFYRDHLKDVNGNTVGEWRIKS